jgi:transcriptional regulator with XRE-family HTH domain
MLTTTSGTNQQIETAPSTPPRARRTINRIGSAALLSPSEPATPGERMVHRRLQLGLTQAQISSRIQLRTKKGRTLSRTNYCMYETGKYEPKLWLIEQIAAALDVSAGWLAFGTKDISSHGNHAGSVVPLSISLRWSGLTLHAFQGHAEDNSGPLPPTLTGRCVQTTSRLGRSA